MTDNDGRIVVDDLVAYAEGRLPAGTPLRERIEQHLSEHPDDAARVQTYARQDSAIRNTWQRIAEEPIPARLQPARIAAARTAGVHHGWPAALAASVVIAASTGWLLGRADMGMSSPPAVERFARDVAGQYTATPATPVETDGITAVSADQRSPLRMAGMQLLGQEAKDELQHFQYASPDGQRLQLFVSPAEETASSPLNSIKGEGFNFVYWEQDSAMYALGGTMSVHDLEAMAFNAMAEIAGGPASTPDRTDTPQPAFEVEPLPWDIVPDAAMSPEFPLTRVLEPLEEPGSL